MGSKWVHSGALSGAILWSFQIVRNFKDKYMVQKTINKMRKIQEEAQYHMPLLRNTMLYSYTCTVLNVVDGHATVLVYMYCFRLL